VQLERGDTKPKGCTEAPKGGSLNFTLDASGNLGGGRDVPRRVDPNPEGGWFVTSGKLGVVWGFLGLRLENTEKWRMDRLRDFPLICFFLVL